MFRFTVSLCLLFVVKHACCIAQVSNTCPTSVPTSNAEWYRCAWQGDPHFVTWCNQWVHPQGQFNGWNYDNTFRSSVRNLTHGGSTYNVINSTHFRVNIIVDYWTWHMTITKAAEFVFISSRRYYVLTRNASSWTFESIEYRTDEYGAHGMPFGPRTIRNIPLSTTATFIRSHADDGNLTIAKLLPVRAGEGFNEWSRLFSFEFYTGLGSNGWSLTDSELECKKNLAHVVTWSGLWNVEINMNKNAAGFFNDDPTRNMNAQMPTVGWCGNPLRQNHRSMGNSNCTANYQIILDAASDRYNSRFKKTGTCKSSANPDRVVCPTSHGPSNAGIFNDWEHSFEAVPSDLLDRNHLFMTVSTQFNDHARRTYLNPFANAPTSTGRNQFHRRRLLSENSNESASIGVFSDPARYENAARLCNQTIDARNAIRVEQGFAPSSAAAIQSSFMNCIFDFGACPQDKSLEDCSDVPLSNAAVLSVVDRGTEIVDREKAEKWAAKHGNIQSTDGSAEGMGIGAIIALGAVGSVLFVGLAAVGIKRFRKK